MNQVTITTRNPLAFHAGQVLAACLPQRRAQQQRVFTIPSLGAPIPMVDRLIRYYLGHRHLDDPRSLETFHRDFWQRQSPADWYQYGEERHLTRHVPLFGEIFKALGPELQRRGITRVCEFGCGDGRWLKWLSEQWPSVTQFQGVDLSSAQIVINRQRYPGLSFDDGHLVDWARAHAAPDSLFLTHCGVLEYLSQASLDELLATLRERAPRSMISFVEPVDVDLDLNIDVLPSRPHGDEFSWSHHYPGRLRAAGCRIEQQHEIDMDGFRMLVVVASLP